MGCVPLWAERKLLKKGGREYVGIYRSCAGTFVYGGKFSLDQSGRIYRLRICSRSGSYGYSLCDPIFALYL